MAAPAGSMNLEPTNAQVKRLVLQQLKNVCKGAGLPVSGTKAALQTRIINQLQLYAAQGYYDGVHQLKTLVSNPIANPQTPPAASARTYPSNPMGTHYPTFQNSVENQPYRNGPVVPHMTKGIGTRGPHFKQSPFFTIIEPLTAVTECPVRDANRDTVYATINLNTRTADAINNDKSTRVLIYCAAEPGVSPFARVDISFPHQVEIKVNQDETKANLRGLKNKPGTTRPADVTDLIRKRPNYNNSVAVTYALTKSRYYLVVNLAKQHSVEELVAKLKSGKIITRDRVLREMASKAEDSDVVATSTILSLKCPLSTLRIQVPCRSTLCNHIQCFDATSFLQLQEQAPTWACPICNKTVTFENLHLDQYVDSILKATPKSIDQVTIEPLGQWSMKSAGKASPSLGASRSSNEENDDEDDLVEIQGLARLKTSIKSEFNQDLSMLRTPPISSREASTSSAARQPSNKRPAAAVVDLTLSSDEDEEPVRPLKRQQTSAISNVPPVPTNSDALERRPSGIGSTPYHHPSFPPPPYQPYATAQYHAPP